MWPYVAMFFGALGIDLIPVIGPPVWTLMIFMLVKYDLNPWLVLAAGVPGSVLGRYGLSLYVPRFFSKVIKQTKSDELQYAGSKLDGSLWRIWPFVLLYSLLPLSTTALFSAAGLARIRPFLILPPFFVGKFISDAVMLFSGRYALGNAMDPVHGMLTAKGLTTIGVGGLILAAFLFLDWRLLLEKHEVRVNFRIWR